LGDVQAFLNAQGQPAVPQAREIFMQAMLERTRRELSVERVERDSWRAAFDDTSRAAQRESGRHLLGLALQYTLRTTGRETVLEEGRRMGREYGRDAAQRGLSLVDTVRAFLFFRETMVRSTTPGSGSHRHYDAEDVHIHASMREFLDQVLFATIEGYEDSYGQVLNGE
jgi:hypothetical protein